jgi:hypothetical protein
MSISGGCAAQWRTKSPVYGCAYGWPSSGEGGNMETKVINESIIEGDLIFDGNIEFKDSGYVTGKIEVTGSIVAGGSIEAGRSIKAVGSIEAGGYIFSFFFEIICKKLITSRLPFCREYWAAQIPLKKYYKIIVDSSLHWNDYKEMVSAKEAKKICAWVGWHWILRAQLEMFFGIKKEYVVKKEV